MRQIVTSSGVACVAIARRGVVMQHAPLAECSGGGWESLIGQ